MITFTIPIKTPNPLNGPQGRSRGAAFAKAARRKQQRLWTSASFKAADGELSKVGGYAVRMIRVSAGELDTDGLQAALKSVRDQIAEELGVSDGPNDDRVSWHYSQKKCKRGQWAVEVEIT